VSKVFLCGWMKCRSQANQFILLTFL
jgi:hypothetical protein